MFCVLIGCSREAGGDGETRIVMRASNALVIVNPASGRDDGAHIQEQLQSRLAADGCRCVQRLTTGAGDAAAWAAGAGMEGFDVVIAVGGDGTLAETVGGMCNAERRIPIAYVPAGSANLAARALGIDAAAGAAIETVATGVAVPFDVGVLPERERYFLVAAAIGYPASLVRDAPRALKKRFGFVAYLIGALRNASHFVRPADPGFLCKLPGPKARSGFTVRRHRG
jgi:diacylglycerol kinase family enzyme